MEFKGITRDALFLMADNRFRDSRAYYEEHKEQIKSSVTIPMRQLAEIIGTELISLDPLMNTIPTKMVSRVRRDTRYTHDKSLYRENMWIMFMRPKHEWQNYPCMWFEVSPREYSMGVGFFGNASGLMEIYRKALKEKPEEFIQAAIKCEKAGAYLSANHYKRGFKDCPMGLEDYYNCKDFYYISVSQELDNLADDTIVEIMRKTYKAYSPMYKFLLDISDEYFSKEE